MLVSRQKKSTKATEISIELSVITTPDPHRLSSMDMNHHLDRVTNNIIMIVGKTFRRNLLIVNIDVKSYTFGIITITRWSMKDIDTWHRSYKFAGRAVVAGAFIQWHCWEDERLSSRNRGRLEILCMECDVLSCCCCKYRYKQMRGIKVIIFSYCVKKYQAVENW